MTPHYVDSVKLERDFRDQYTICVEGLLAALAISCRETKMEVVLSELNDIEICVLDKKADTGWQKNKREDKRNVFSIKN